MLMKIISCVLLVFLSAAMLSTARLMHTGAEVNGSSAIKPSIANSTTSKTMVKTLVGIEENMKNLGVNQVIMRKVRNANKSTSRVQDNRSLRSSHLYDEVDKGLMAFTADYHRPKHHPPKNN
ncbi:unnamed protein product [Lupinus luteus]|uniref:Uncharacterized protein n=1 Tax=Lupinus luteus TaxID=3873 RepID=A0AAV1WFR5_LUPLU